MSNNIWSVSYLLSTIKSTLDQNVLLKSFWIKGEISNFTAHSSGHWYFSLKDDQARISCIMFQGYTKEVLFKPKNGDKVLVRGSITVYNLQGQLQCSVFSMQNDGLGDLFLQFELLKKKLFEEGLFDINHKKQLPKYPESIGIITGDNTAALQDILKTLGHRWPVAKLTIYPCLVQGEQAPNSIIKQLNIADQRHDVLILARGGGSIEDLWAFNNEKLARVIYDLKTPIITGVGHETDTTIVDLVSDFRAPTPTGAAQAATPSIDEIKRNIERVENDLIRTINELYKSKQNKLNQFKQSKYIASPLVLLQQHQLELSMLSHKLASQNIVLQNNKNILYNYKNKLNQLALTQSKVFVSKLDQANLKLNHSINNYQERKINQFKNSVSILNAYSPLNSLARGYSITKQSGHIVKLVEELDYENEFEVRLFDGTVYAKPIKKGE
jgi:exodeoxyribonuclease VII large subunit